MSNVITKCQTCILMPWICQSAGSATAPGWFSSRLVHDSIVDFPIFFLQFSCFQQEIQILKSEIWDNFPAVLKELLLVTECFVERSIAWRNFQHPILCSSVFCLWLGANHPPRPSPKSNQVTILGVEGMTSGSSSWGKLKIPPQFDYWASQPAPYKA